MQTALKKALCIVFSCALVISLSPSWAMAADATLFALTGSEGEEVITFESIMTNLGTGYNVDAIDTMPLINTPITTCTAGIYCMRDETKDPLDSRFYTFEGFANANDKAHAIIKGGITEAGSYVAVFSGNNACAYKGTLYSNSFNVLEITLGDINNNSKVNIVDAQIVLDMANGAWTTETEFDKLLEQLPSNWNLAVCKATADVNTDNTVNALDARANQAYVHTGSFQTSAA